VSGILELLGYSDEGERMALAPAIYRSLILPVRWSLCWSPRDDWLNALPAAVTSPESVPMGRMTAAMADRFFKVKVRA